MRLWSGKPSSVSRWADPAARWGTGGVRYDAVSARRGHVEAWSLKASDPEGRRAISLRWTIWAGERDPRRAIAEAWAVAFGTRHGHVATKTSVPFEAAAFRRASLGVTVDGAALSEASARGRVESGGRAIGYDLDITALEPVHWPAPSIPLPPYPLQRIASPVPNARIRGVVEVEGEIWSLDGWPGMVGHQWGRAHAEAQAWGHCNAWDDGDDVVIEGFTARARAGPLPLRSRTAIAVRHDGVTSVLSGALSLVRPTQTEGSISPRRWCFRARAPRLEVDGEMWADTDDLVGLFYQNPDGTTVHCLHTKLAHAEVTLRFEGRAPKALRSRQAALEIATNELHHGVRMHV